VEKTLSPGPSCGGVSTGTAFSGGQADSFASLAAPNFAVGRRELKGPGGGGKVRKANWSKEQKAIMEEEYKANRNPSREAVERVVARLGYTMDYKQASPVLCEARRSLLLEGCCVRSERDGVCSSVTLTL